MKPNIVTFQAMFGMTSIDGLGFRRGSGGLHFASRPTAVRSTLNATRPADEVARRGRTRPFHIPELEQQVVAELPPRSIAGGSVDAGRSRGRVPRFPRAAANFFASYTWRRLRHFLNRAW